MVLAVAIAATCLIAASAVVTVSTVKNVVASGKSQTSVTLTWDKAKNVDGYIIYYKDVLDRACTAFKQKTANCYSYAAAVTMIARNLGFNANGRSDYFYTAQNEGNVRHGWCEVTENGKTYICDAELESCFSKRNNLGWKLFFVKKTLTPCKYL